MMQFGNFSTAISSDPDEIGQAHRDLLIAISYVADTPVAATWRSNADQLYLQAKRLDVDLKAVQIADDQ